MRVQLRCRHGFILVHDLLIVRGSLILVAKLFLSRLLLNHAFDLMLIE